MKHGHEESSTFKSSSTVIDELYIILGMILNPEWIDMASNKSETDATLSKELISAKIRAGFVGRLGVEKWKFIPAQITLKYSDRFKKLAILALHDRQAGAGVATMAR